MSTKPVVVYGASGYTGRLVCEYLREHNLPFIAAGRSKDRLASSMERNVPGIETADYEIAEVEHSIDGLTKLLTGAKVAHQHRRPVRRVRPRGRAGLPRRRVPLHRHHRRAGLDDRRATRSTGRSSPTPACSSPPAWPRCTRPARSPPRSPWSTCPASTPSTSRCSGRAPRPLASTATDPRQRRHGQGQLPRGEPVRRVARRRRPLQRRRARPARARPGPAVGRHVASGLVQARPPGRRTSRSSAGSSTGR